MTMSDISIHPIFNQAAPRIWDDFLRIRIAAMLVNYDVPMTAREIHDARAEYVRDWNRLSHNFAFAAYDDAYMIGYINGAIKSNVAEIFNLYVLPEYQGKLIGRRLLASAERAVAPFANKIHLISWYGAQNFYKQQGCQPIGNTAEFTKKLLPAVCCTIPIFHLTPTMVQKCKNIAACAGVDFSADTINCEHKPMFMNINADSNITGYGIYDYSTGEPYPTAVTPNSNPHSGEERRLMYALDSFNIHKMQLNREKETLNGR